MEDVLEVYAEPYDPRRPKVNFDETSKQLIKETRLPLPAQAGQPPRWEDEAERHGTRHLFLFVAPPAGRRHVQVTAPRTKVDWAHAMQWLGDLGAPAAAGMRVGLDKRNTQKSASLYEACEPAEARRMAKTLALHSTPNHGSWLHMADIAFSVLQPQCLDRRLPDADTLTRASAAWEHQRNAEQATIDWRFSVTDARKKLERLSPSLPA
jgi:DDE superfamily endonuclease